MVCRSPPLFRVEANTKSDHAQRNANSETVTTALRDSGMTTEEKTRIEPAPSIRAADTSSPGIPDMNAVKISTPNGTASVESAMIKPHQSVHHRVLM